MAVDRTSLHVIIADMSREGFRESINGIYG